MADLEKQAAIQNEGVVPATQTHHPLHNNAPVMLGASDLAQLAYQNPQARFRTLANPAPL